MKSYLIDISDIYSEWKIRIKEFLRGNRIVVKNKGFIQWNDLTFIHRAGWYNKFSIEEMEEMKKGLKD